MVPHSMAFDSAGNIYVSDMNNHRIQKFTSDGEFITKWGTEGNGDGQFGLPLGIGSDSKGNIFIIDQATSSIPQFSNEGEFINNIIFNFGKLEDIEIDSNDHIYVTDRNKNEILKFSKMIK
jgi:tripartite motif-containing protein 71